MLIGEKVRDLCVGIEGFRIKVTTLRRDMSRPSYIGLLRENRTFRKLFFANEISFIGDWFTVIALFLIAGESSNNSPLAIAGVLATRSFTFAPLEPFTGMFADKYSRKSLMLISNIFSFLILISVLSLELLDNLFSVYLISITLVIGRAIFDPAQTAYLPNICTEEELLTANAIISGGWSAAMGIGAGIGGLAISEFGVDLALWIDSITFLFAALIIYTLPEGGPKKSNKKEISIRIIFKEILDGWKYIRYNSPIRRVVGAKGMWASGGGAQVFLIVLIGMEVGFGEIAAGIGILYMARGFGSGFGPLAGKSIMTNTRLRPYIPGIAISISGIFYIAVGIVEWNFILLLLIFISHASSGINWVYSTTLLQERTEDEWRGRVSGSDNLVITLTMGISTIIAGLIMEYELLELRETIGLTGIIQILVGFLWLIFSSSNEKKYFDSKEKICFGNQ